MLEPGSELSSPVSTSNSNRFPWVTLACVALALVAAALPESWHPAYQFDRDALLHGEPWRAFTSHFLHWTPGNLAWNVAAFAVVGAMVEVTSRRQLVILLSTSAKIIPLVLLAADPTLQFYRGLSGFASALFVAAALNWFVRARAERSRLGAALAIAALAGFVAKITSEFLSGATVFAATDASFRPVPLAHLTGGLIAVVTFAVQQVRARRAKRAADRATCHPIGDNPRIAESRQPRAKNPPPSASLGARACP